jgi:hypothetical protein
MNTELDAITLFQTGKMVVWELIKTRQIVQALTATAAFCGLIALLPVIGSAMEFKEAMDEAMRKDVARYYLEHGRVEDYKRIIEVKR